MNEIIYLDPDEEITSVIDKLRKTKSAAIALVIPRGANLAQSIVNLKLLNKSASELNKEISLVSNDRISRNLASQIGITVFSKVSEAEKSRPSKPEAEEVAIENPEGYRINSYYQKKQEEEAEEEAEEDQAEKEEIQGEDEEEAVDEEELKTNENKNFSDPDFEEVEEDDIEDEIRDEIDRTELDEGDLEDHKRREEPVKKQEESVKKQESTPKSGIENRKEEISSTEKEDGDFEKKPINRDVEVKKVNEDKEAKVKKKMSRPAKIILSTIATCLILGIGISYVFLPYATIAVTVKTKDLTVDKTVSVDQSFKSVDGEKLVLPGKTVELQKEVSKTYSTTGKKDIGEKAIGKITIVNQWSTDSEKFPKGTKFISGTKAYFSTVDVVLPGETIQGPPMKVVPSSVEVSVEAENAGESYNIGPSNFTIAGLTGEKQKAITGKSTVAMAGGTTKTLNFVQDKDLADAEADLLKDGTDSNKTELLVKGEQQDLKLFEDKISSEEISKESTKNVNDEADSFDLKLTIKLSTFGFLESDAKELMTGLAQAKLADTQMLINPDKSELAVKLDKNDPVAPLIGKAKLTFTAKYGEKIDSKAIQEKLKGKKSAQAKNLIEENKNVEKADVKIWPSNLFRVPIIKNRIKVSFDYAK